MFRCLGARHIQPKRKIVVFYSYIVSKYNHKQFLKSIKCPIVTEDDVKFDNSEEEKLNYAA